MPRLYVAAARAAAIAAATGALAGGCGSGTLPTNPRIVRVVAAENVWGSIAAQIGGSHVEVMSLINDPNADPHLFESSPQAVAAVANAQLVIVNGAGYDPFMDRMLSTGGRHGRVVLSVEQVLGVTGDNPNPHLWYWTARLPQVAAAIAAQLSAIDPTDHAFFETGARRFTASLRPLLATIATIRRKYAGTAVGYTERVAGDLVAAAGLRLATPASFARAIEDGNDPSPGDIVTFDSAIENGAIKVLLYNAQVVDVATTRIKQLAGRSHVPVVGVTETMPSTDASFQAWQLRQDRELLRALGG